MQITSSELGLAARVAGLTKTYGTGSGAVTALDDVSVGIRSGEFTAVIGASGSGKSTLMHIMAGLDTPTTGRVWLGDRELTGLGDRELTRVRRRSAGFVFQSFNLVPVLDVRANVLLPFELDGRHPNREELGWIDHLIGALGLSARTGHRPYELSGGQQQRVAIARALATRPHVIFADEPTGNLDSRTGREVLALLAQASVEYGQSVAMVTHDPVAASHADRIIMLADGRIVHDGGRLAAADVAELMLSAEPAR
ncbi:ABC transporter ATP-binding protein [Rathayibacter sp. KR2-224]|uniref:ABC transporter ATP-binding protein n=1 Tax=Rathayibacter sp. KR2-224 TaxID=3400913 RepID=UPI003C0E0B5E